MIPALSRPPRVVPDPFACSSPTLTPTGSRSQGCSPTLTQNCDQMTTEQAELHAVMTSPC